MFRLRLRSALLCASIGVLSFSASYSPTPAHAATKPERLPDLAAQVSAQFELAYRSYPAEGESRQSQLNAVVAAWRSAPRTDANNERLNNWLRASIRASMPGSRDPLPPAPSFGATAKAKPDAVRAPEPTPASEVTKQPKDESPKTESQLDPFRDDPADKQATK